MAFDPLSLILELESEIIDNMNALLSRGAVASAEWQAQKLMELGSLRLQNIETVEKYLTEVQSGLNNFYKTASLDELKKAGIPGLSDVLPMTLDSTLARVWLIWETQTMNQLRTLGMTLIESTSKMYIDIIYKTTAKMLAGSLTLRQAIAQTAMEWESNGLTGLVDKGGREWSTEAYSQMVLRSNETQVVWASQTAAFDEFGVDLVEISSHLGARELCAPYQGKVYSRSGLSTQFPALSSTSIGQIAGLFGINCGHRPYAYNPAVGKTYQTYSKKENDEAYAESQKQRYYERQIRKAKRELSAAEISKDPTIINAAKSNVSKAQARMREFIDDSGRARRRDREQIY